MNVLALHGQRAALQQEQLCSETTEEPEAAAPAAQTDRHLITLWLLDTRHV